MPVGKIHSSLTPQELYEAIPEETLWSQYFGITEIPCKINAPYRKDNNPSLSIYYNKNNKIVFKDFGTGNSGDILTLLSLVWGVSLRTVIDRVTKAKYQSGSCVKHTNKKKIKKNPLLSDIQVKVREWRDYDLEYWETYGISLPWLKFARVYPISKIFFTNSLGETRSYPAEKYAYCYVENKDGKTTLKIYQPFSTTNKWMSKHDASVWDLWTQIPKEGKKLIITSSRKDAICLWENTGIPAVALQGEGYIPKKHIVDQLKHRFQNIYVLYDNDFQAEKNYGREDGKKICAMFDLKQIEIPTEYQAKDPSDLVKKYSREVLKDILTKLIKKADENIN